MKIVWFLLFFLPVFGLFIYSLIALCFVFSSLWLWFLCFVFSSLYCDFYVKLYKNLCFLACIFFSSPFSLPCMYLMNLCPQMYLYLTLLYSIFTPLIYLLSRPHCFVFFFVILLFEYNILLYLYFHIMDIFPPLVVFRSFNYLYLMFFNDSSNGILIWL